MKVFALGLLVVGLTGTATPVHVSIRGKPPTAVAGKAWTVRLSVRPASFRGIVRITAAGPSRARARATARPGSYRAKLVFSRAGRWTLTARAGGSVSRLGSVRVRPAPPQPLAFTQPTAIDLEPAGTLLLVENNPGRVLRVNPGTGRVTVLVPSMSAPYAVVRAPSGTVFVSSGNLVRRLDAAGTPTTVAQADTDIGPLAVAANGDLYYATSTRVFRLAGGVGPPIHIAGTGVEGGGGDGGPAVNAQIEQPHGLAIAADGALLVSDTGNERIRRIDLGSGVITTLALVGTPDGIDVGPAGTISVVDSRARRIVRFSASGTRIGFFGPLFGLPYDVEATADGGAYLLEAGPLGRLRRVAPNGTVTTVSRKP
jgi:streptogramin lyase